MAEKRENNTFLHKIRRFFSGFTSLILVLVLIAVIYLAAVLLHTPEGNDPNAWVVEEEEIISPLQAATSSDVRALAQLLGAPLPQISGHAPTGEARNAIHDGQNVRQVTLTYPGLTVTAVRPASAAPLLLRNELSIQSRSDLTVMNLPAVWARKENSHCLYFSSEFAAYSIYAPNATEEEFLSVITQITQVK